MGFTVERFKYSGSDLEAMVAARNYSAWILEEIIPYLGRNVVEVGAGVGNFSKMILEAIQPDRFVAIEPADNLQPILASNLEPYSQAQIVKSFLPEVKREFQPAPDTILYINVLEHVANDAEELKSAYNILNRGGHICIFVPALTPLYSEFDYSLGHYRRYGRRELHELVQATQLKIVKSLYFDLLGIFPWWFFFCLMKKSTLCRSQIAVYDNVVVPFAKVIERRIVPPIGKNILIVGRK